VPRKSNILRVFISAPSDITEEIKIIEKIIQELNKTWSEHLGISLESFYWKNDSYPDISTSAQEVINEQIDDKYDIFIGILWKKFGTPTGSACSGTEEEFTKAYDKYKREPNSIKIMFYFNTTPIPINEIEPEQISKINKFKANIGEKGTLYWEYQDIREFEYMFRIHLTKHVQSWKEDNYKNIANNDLAETNMATEIDDEEVGLYDLWEILDEKSDAFQKSMERMTQFIKDFGNRINARTEEVKQFKFSKESPDYKSAKRIINRTVSDMNDYNLRMNVEIPLFSEAYASAIEVYSKILSLKTEFSKTDDEVNLEIKKAILELEEMLEAISKSIVEVGMFRSTIANWPRLTTAINKAKRKTIYILDWLIKEMEKSKSLTFETIKAFKQ